MREKQKTPGPCHSCGPNCKGCSMSDVCNVPTSPYYKKKKLNQIMKENKPWSVGVSTKLTANSFFYPVQYYKPLDIWFGVYRYTNTVWKTNRIEWRKGSHRGYYILDRINSNLITDVRISEHEIDAMIKRIKGDV